MNDARGSNQTYLLQNIGKRRIADVHQHVGVRTVTTHGHVIVGARSKIVIYGFLLGTPGHHVVVEFAPFAITFRIDEYYVMATVVVTGVYENSVQGVVGGSVLFLFEELVEIQLLSELEPETNRKFELTVNR